MNRRFTRENSRSRRWRRRCGRRRCRGRHQNYAPGRLPAAKAELDTLVDKSARRVATVAWAASNGDRSEKRRLHLRQEAPSREIDRRIRFLVRPPRSRRKSSIRLPDAMPTTPTASFSVRPCIVRDRARRRAHGEHRRRRTKSTRRAGYISWMSPMARALIKAREGDAVPLVRRRSKNSRFARFATNRWTPEARRRAVDAAKSSAYGRLAVPKSRGSGTLRSPRCLRRFRYHRLRAENNRALQSA